MPCSADECVPHCMWSMIASSIECLHNSKRVVWHWQVIEKACAGKNGSAAARMEYVSRLLPLHILCRYNARDEASVRAMAQAHPPALGLCDTRGCLPLHFACAGGASCAVIALLLRLYPESAGQADEQGFVALHYLAMSFGSSAYLLDEAVARQASVTDSLQSLRLLIQADQSMVTKNSPLGLPLDCLAKVLVPFPIPTHTVFSPYEHTVSREYPPCSPAFPCIHTRKCTN